MAKRSEFGERESGAGERILHPRLDGAGGVEEKEGEGAAAGGELTVVRHWSGRGKYVTFVNAE